MLEETSVLGAQPIDVPMSPNHKLLKDGGELFGNSSKYHLLVGKLNYLTITRRDISSACVVGQFLEASRVFTLTCPHLLVLDYCIGQINILEWKSLPILTRQVLSQIEDLWLDILPLLEIISYIKE